MSRAAHNHYAAREGAAPTAADARREAVAQPTTPAPAGAVLAEDFRIASETAARVNASSSAAFALEREPYDPETMAFGRRVRGPFARLED